MKASPGQLGLFSHLNDVTAPVVEQEKPVMQEPKTKHPSNVGNADPGLNVDPYCYYDEFTEEQKELKKACPLRDECGCCCHQSCYEWALKQKQEKNERKFENWHMCAKCVRGNFVGAEFCGKDEKTNKWECWNNNFKFYEPDFLENKAEEKPLPFYTCPRCGKNKGKALVPNFSRNVFDSDLVCAECMQEMECLEE